MNGENYSNKLPTILIIGGFSGEDTLSPLLVKRLLNKLLSFSKDNEINKLLNNHRLLLIPSINPEGQFNKREAEKTEDGTTVNVSEDFNYGIKSNKKCFKSSSARILAHILKVYIIKRNI